MLGLIIIVLLLIAVCAIGSWSIHRGMVLDECKRYGYASFKQFNKQYENHNMELDGTWKWSLFENYPKNRYHASLIIFDGKGMIMKNPIEWIKVKMFMFFEIRSKHKEIREANVIKWD